MYNTRYSKEPFQGYTNRFRVELYTSGTYTMDIYSNNRSYGDLAKFLNLNTSEKVTGWRILFRVPKEEDDVLTSLINNL